MENEVIAEYGGGSGLWEPKLYIGGREVHNPVCPKCGVYKGMIMSDKVYSWFCINGCKEKDDAAD